MVVTVKCNLQQQMGHWHQYITHMRAGEGESILGYCIVLELWRRNLLKLLWFSCDSFCSACYVVIVSFLFLLLLLFLLLMILLLLLLLLLRKLTLMFCQNRLANCLNIKFMFLFLLLLLILMLLLLLLLLILLPFRNQLYSLVKIRSIISEILLQLLLLLLSLLCLLLLLLLFCYCCCCCSYLCHCC